jgi:hypothetical protein
MFTPGGQLDLTFACIVRGGGKGGGSSSSSPQVTETTLTDPVNGKSFTSYTTGNPMYDMMLGYSSGQSAQDQLNAEITSREATEAQTSAATTAAATAKSASDEATFQQNKQNAYDTAMQQVVREFQLQGVDPNQYMESDIKPALQYQMNTIQDLDPAPQSAFPTNLGASIVSDVTSGKRTQALNSLNNVFTPTYATDQLPNAFADPYVSQAVSNQFTPLSQQLVNAQKRNLLTNQGYTAAQNALLQKQAGATSTVTDLGQGILNTDRSNLNSFIGGARTDANNLSLAANFDPNAYSNTAQSMVGTDKSTFGGALQNAIGNTQFSDITSLINAGGAAQGAQDPMAAGGKTTPAGSGSANADDNTQLQVQNQPRGLGSQGAF